MNGKVRCLVPNDGFILGTNLSLKKKNKEHLFIEYIILYLWKYKNQLNSVGYFFSDNHRQRVKFDFLLLLLQTFKY